MSNFRIDFYPPPKPVKPLAFVTMAKNEFEFIEAWILNGLSISPDAHFYIIDHASSPPIKDTVDQISVELRKVVSVINIPGISFDDDFKAMAISGLAKMLLQAFEIVVATDCDELLYGNGVAQGDVLGVIKSGAEIISPIGFEVVQHVDREGKFNPAVPIFKQRRFGFFASGYSKPVIWRKGTEFGAGLHRCRDEFGYESSLLLAHLRSVDQGIAAARSEQRRIFDLSEEQIRKGRDTYWRNESWKRINFFERLRKADVQPMDKIMPDFVKRMEGTYHRNAGSFWGHDISLTSVYCELI